MPRTIRARVLETVRHFISHVYAGIKTLYPSCTYWVASTVIVIFALLSISWIAFHYFSGPPIQYWKSPSALFAVLSFAVTIGLGVVPLIDGEHRGLVSVLLFVSLIVTVLGWWSIAEQERKSAESTVALDQARRMLEDITGSVNKLERNMPTTAPPELAVLASDTPDWMKVAYKELGQAEIPGPAENPHVVEYFEALKDRRPHRDDIDDWSSAFVEWSLNQVGVSGPKSQDPFAWLRWGRMVSNPSIGSIVVMSFSGLRHVGFFFADEGDFIRVLGGNQDDGVRIYRYPKFAVVGYRLPSVE